MKGKLITAAIAVLVAAALFFAGRWTAPAADDQAYHRKMDSVVKIQKQADYLRDQALMREDFYKAEALKSFSEGIAYGVDSIKKSKKQHDKDVDIIRSATPDQRDSMLWKRYQRLNPALH